MQQYIILLSLLAILTYNASGQIAGGGTPVSFGLTEKKATSVLPVVSMPQLDAELLQKDEAVGQVPMKYGIYTDTIIDVKAFGKKDIVTGKGTLWRLRISTQNAKSVQVIFSSFVIPHGAKLFLYNDSKSQLAGSFTALNMHPDSSFSLADFRGDHVIIEYFEPEQIDFEGEIIIGAIAQAYKDLLEVMADEDFININCPIGKNAQLPKHAVCKMSFRSDGSQALCSGALINNTDNDGVPYFLTANHCISTSAEASSLITYFNYENVGCNGETLTPLSLSGATLLSTSQSSDYTLLLLSEIPTPDHQPYYAGWDIRDTMFQQVVSIHHPEGYPKKISFDYDSIETNSYSLSWDDGSSSPVGSHWQVEFDDGLTSQGSSGAPLFNPDYQIIGQLHGGSDNVEFYGKLAYSYKKANTEPYLPLHVYLDPDTTGIEVLGGYTPQDNTPDAFFTSRFSEACVSFPVSFTDHSVFGPYSRKWSVSPGTGFEFAGGTSDTSANPSIAFNSALDYTVTLDLSVKGDVKSSESLTIAVGTELALQVKSHPEGKLCDCDFDQVELSAIGAIDYSWEITGSDTLKAALSPVTGDTVLLLHRHDYLTDQSYSIGVRLTGEMGTCSDTLLLNYELIKPVNDNIANAVLLNYGESEVFSNICASIEDGEPIPPYTSCTGQLSWCDEYGTGMDIVENSVWFKFVASSTGLVSLSSTGFDNQIALYEADTYEDMLTGDYVLLGANDDRTDLDPRPLIKSATVIPGQTYWIQVDGSGGGLEEDFTLRITELTVTASNAEPIEAVKVYPQPAKESITIQCSEITGPAILSVYNATGRRVINNQIDMQQGKATIYVDMLEDGLYLLTIYNNGRKYTGRMLKH